MGNPPTASGLSLQALVLNHLVRNSLNNITKLLACARALELNWADTAIKAGAAAAVTVEATSSTTMTYSVVNPPLAVGPGGGHPTNTFYEVTHSMLVIYYSKLCSQKKYIGT